MKREPVYDETASVVPMSPFVTMGADDVIRAIISGMGVGLVTAGAMHLLNTFIFSAVLCRPQSVSDCAQAPTYAMIVAMVLGAIVGLVALARLRIYRPLLVVLAATIALWGLASVLSPLAWYWDIICSIVLFGLAYGLFAWLARIRNFIMSLVVTIVVVVIVRLLLVA